MGTPRPIGSCKEMDLVLNSVANFDGSNGLSRVVVIHFFDDRKDTIPSKLNTIALSAANVHHCILVEVFQPKANNDLLQNYLAPAVQKHGPPPAPGNPGAPGPVLAFYDERGNLVNFLKNFIFHAFKVGI